MACSNCGGAITCGCQRRTASNGASVCANCLASYEAALKVAKSPKKDDQTLTPLQKVLTNVAR